MSLSLGNGAGGHFSSTNLASTADGATVLEEGGEGPTGGSGVQLSRRGTGAGGTRGVSVPIENLYYTT